MTKFLYTFFVVSLLIGSTSAQASNTEAEGKVFYVAASGEIVKRDVTLEVPSRGQGDIILRNTSRSFESTAHAARSQELNGRVVFTVLFLNPGNMGDDLVFRGSYMRGSNKAVYFGDMFKKPTGTGHSLDIESIERSILDHHAGWNHAGGFKFKTDM